MHKINLYIFSRPKEIAERHHMVSAHLATRKHKTGGETCMCPST